MAIQTSQAMKNLIDLGKEHGYLTLEEISRTVSVANMKSEEVDELMTALEDATEDKLECSIVGKECDECDAAKRPCPYKEPVEDVAHQPHYEDSALQPIEIMRLNFSPEMFKGFLLGNVLKYTLRYDKKDGVKDLEKAQVYLGWLVDHEKRAVI